MSLPLLLHGVGSIGVFASRAFLPAFVTALLLRFGPQVPGLMRVGLLGQVRGVPTWFTSDIALVVLGVLATLELLAERFPEARAVLREVHGYLKAGMAAATYLGVLNATDRGAVAPLLNQAGVFETIPVLLVAVGTLLVARTQGALLNPLVEADEDDDLGFQKLLQWAGDCWGALGPLTLIVFPLLTLAAFGGTIGLLFWVERRVEARGDKFQVACAGCLRMIHPSAVACPFCQAPVDQPRAVGLLGQPREVPANSATLPFDLVAVKRCPKCATRLRQRVIDPTCGACGHRLLADPAFATDYIAAIDRRVPLACALGFGLGLIPVLGVIPGVIAYRLLIVAPFRRYIPSGQGILLRWGVRAAVLGLVALQWVPVAGALAVPSMGLISYFAYRSAYRRLALTT